MSNFWYHFSRCITVGTDGGVESDTLGETFSSYPSFKHLGDEYDTLVETVSSCTSFKDVGDELDTSGSTELVFCP